MCRGMVLNGMRQCPIYNGFHDVNYASLCPVVRHSSEVSLRPEAVYVPQLMMRFLRSNPAGEQPFRRSIRRRSSTCVVRLRCTATSASS